MWIKSEDEAVHNLAYAQKLNVGTKPITKTGDYGTPISEEVQPEDALYYVQAHFSQSVELTGLKTKAEAEKVLTRICNALDRSKDFLDLTRPEPSNQLGS